MKIALLRRRKPVECLTTYYLLLITYYLLLSSCHGPAAPRGLHFTFLPASETGVDFSNTIIENDSLNMFTNEYTYMGGGVGMGDFNKDGLPDVFFAGNQVSSQLYINKGGMKFENRTTQAGVATAAWCTGVSVVDINNDGWPDIYVCVSGNTTGAKRKNLLFINQHNLTFTEEAAAYGLADSGYATQAVFFDYDRDGRLDMYLLNHTLTDNRPNDIRDNKVDSTAIAADKLFHNDGIPAGGLHPVYRDVSRVAGITEDGNGLGVVVSDFNGDGYPDIYVANDYIKNDLLWLNNGNGGFSNCIASATRHQAYSAMGTDAADCNNDGRTDILSLDMQPETNERKKMMYSFLGDQRHQLEMDKGYAPEYIHNMLQLNNGVRWKNNRHEPFFSEIGEMAGIAETDWSWSVLLADLDNDGWKDIHITNGLGRDPTNIDFLEYRRNTVMQSGIPENDLTQRRALVDHLSSLGSVQLNNYLYRNRGGVLFEDVSAAAGIDQASISNGAVYADLDNDGDLDIITNNINGPAFVMRNDLNGPKDAVKAHFLALQLEGAAENKDGIGAVVYAYDKEGAQMLEESPVRGYLSTVDSRLHFGFGTSRPDSLRIVWPDGKTQLIRQPPADTILRLQYRQALPGYQAPAPTQPVFFTDITATSAIDFTHRETFFYDYSFQTLLPQKYSQEGPFISTGDLDGDGREDFFIGGAFKQPGEIFLQQADGHFTGAALPATGTKNEEDMQSILFDADGDGDSDLLVVSGSTEFDLNSSFYRPRLYLNDGRGKFRQDSTAFSPLVRTAGKCIALADMDADGDADIFIGGRVSLGTYPQPPRSYLLRNDHGKFTDVTRELCPALENPGLLNAALWLDIDNDKKPDLIIAGDWMPIRIFKNTGKGFTEISAAAGTAGLPGFWRSLLAADIDGDGDMDLLAGNLGLNNPFHITPDRPAELVSKDFDGNGITEPIFCYYIKDNNGSYQLSAGISRDDWATQMPSIKKQFDRNELYAKAGMNAIFGKEMMEGALVLDCKEVNSGYFENDGRGHFSFHAFPVMAQQAPVNALVCTDITGDGHADIVLAGNEYQASVMTGRYDASYGLLLTGDGKGHFKAMDPVSSGLIIDGDVKDLKIITVGGQRVLLAAINNEQMKAFRLR